MTPEKLTQLFKFYDNDLAKRGISVAQQQEFAITRYSNLEHLRYMCDRALDFVEENRIEKAMRWLGFIQGVLFAESMFNLTELKEHSRHEEY